MRRIASWVRKWWPGLVPLVLLWMAAIWTGTVPFEADLAARSDAALKGTILDKTRIAASGRDVGLSAQAFSEDGRRSAVAQVEAVPGVRLVDDNTTLVPEAKPFVWQIERDVVRITLSGSAPLPAIKARLAEAARAVAGGMEVSDQMGFARGAPPRFEGVALLLADQIGKLKDGRIMLTDKNISLMGTARELGGREAIWAALRNLPEGYSVTENKITAPPYVFQANKDPVANTITLAGYVPDEAARGAIAAAVGRKFFNEKLVDNLKLSVGAPQNFSTAVISALGALSRVSTGALVVSDREVKLFGDALYAVAADQIRASIGGDLPPGWKAASEISVKPVASPVDSTVCQQLFTELLNKSRIKFASGSAAIDPDSLGLLDRLIETALRCPTATFEVAGHTDNEGDPAANQALSEKRAQAVADYLIKAGLPQDRLTTAGYGSSQPIADNDTPEGKAKNRRIDFVVKRE